MADIPTIVLIGRQNVGKSTLFNRLSASRRAITSPVPGTTRDWLEGIAHWGSRLFRVIDTGGYAPGQDTILTAVRAQVERWVKEADMVLWVVDGNLGLTPEDTQIARWLRRLARRVTVVVNKIDDPKRDAQAAEFHRVGFPSVIPISATHGRQINTLLDHLENEMPAAEGSNDPGQGAARVAIVGRPNVGKSSLLNRILGEERSIVSDIPGTTRDTVDTLWEVDDKRFVFTDTAGLRAKKSKASVGLEGLTRLMAEKALDRSEVALLLLDASEGLLEGDTAVALLVQEKRRACVVGVNKWDVVQEKSRVDPASAGSPLARSDKPRASTETQSFPGQARGSWMSPSRFTQWYKEHRDSDLPFLAWAPIVFLSAKTGEHVDKLVDALWDAFQQFHRRFDAQTLFDFFWAAIQERPYSHRGKKLTLKAVDQVGEAPPVFKFHTNMTSEDVHFSYQRHLEKIFRERFDLKGTPLLFRFSRK